MAGSSNSNDTSARVEDLEYLYASNANVSNFVSVKLSNESNYRVWKTQMICLMKTHQMAGIVDDALARPRTLRAEIMDRYDNLLKGWILGSTSENVLGTVVDLTSAKDVWDKLKLFYDVTINHQYGMDADSAPTIPEAKTETTETDVVTVTEETNRNDENMLEIEIIGTEVVSENLTLTKDSEYGRKYLLRMIRSKKIWCKLLVEGDWKGAEFILKKEKDLGRHAISSRLHIAVGLGSNDFLKNFFSYLSAEEVLEKRDSDGCTALHIAAIIGNTYAADLLVKKNSKLLRIEDNKGEEAWHKAYENMHLDTIGYLLKAIDDVDDHDKSKQDSSSLEGYVQPHLHPGSKIGLDLLVNAISAKQYNLALELIEKFPKFASESDDVLMAIAKTFPSGLDYWETLVYPCKFRECVYI